MPLTLSLTSNGATPVPSCGTGGGTLGSVQLSTDAGSTFSTFSCSGPFTTTISVPNGAAIDARLSVFSDTSGPRANLPDTAALPSIVVNGPTTRTLDVSSRYVSGTVSSNGAPVSCAQAGQFGRIIFRNPSTREEFVAYLNCSAAGSQPRYDLWLPQGTFQVVVNPTSLGAVVGDGPILVSPATQVQASTSALNFNVVHYLATLQLQLNGGTPVDDCASNPTAERMRVSLRLQGFGWNADRTVAVSCSAPSGYSVPLQLGSGTYEVFVDSARGALPSSSQPVTIAFFGPGTFTVPFSGYQISGSVTFNGAPLGGCETMASGTWYSGATLALEDQSTGARVKLPMRCGASTTFSGWVPGGTYLGVVENGGAPSAMPNGLTWKMTTPVTISANQSLSMNIATVPFSVSVLTGGVLPQSRCTGPTAEPKVIFSLSAQSGSGPDARLTIPCSAPSTLFSSSGQLFAGSQRLVISSYDTSTLPFFTSVAMPVSVTAGGSITIDVSRHVAGSVVANGAPQASCPLGTRAGMLILRRVSATSESTVMQLSCGAQGSITFDGWVEPGTYEVIVRGEEPSTLPVFMTTVVKALQIP